MTDIYLALGAVLVIIVFVYGIFLTQYRARQIAGKIFWTGVIALFVIVVALIARLATGV